jgi:CAP-Gly domain-containing linker protein 1
MPHGDTDSFSQLNKEITELESLVESKIYREDELERELDTLREAQRKSAKTARKKSKGSSDLCDVPEDRQAPASTSAPTPAANPSTTNGAHSRTTSLIGSESDVCEICERPGHDIFSCDLLRESSSPTMMMSRINVEDSPGPKALTGAHAAASAPAAKPLYCVDCDSEGHTADECPYALDVF